MSPIKDFGGAVEGRIPEAGNATAVVMGKETDPEEVARQIGAAVNKTGSAHPANWLTATTKIAPGGRPEAEIDPELLKGKERFKPKDDMFGAPVAPVAKNS